LRRLLAIAVAFAALIALPLIALAQTQSPEEQKSWFLQFVQDRLSTPERQISISNIEGALSSDASVREVTVSDRDGVYLRLEDIKLNWNQAALLTGRLEINSLTAASIDYLRNPVPPEGAAALPPPEAGGLAVPQLPVAVIVKQLAVSRITFGEQVFGLGSAISLDGAITLDGGSLDSHLAIKRLDGPGGTLDLAAKYDKASTQLDLNLGITEPKDGIIANLLNIAGRPDIRLTVAGAGPVADLTTTLALDAGGRRALSGTAAIDQVAQGFAVDANLNGPIATLVAPAYRDFFGADTRLAVKGLLRSSGGISLEALRLSGGQLNLTGSASTSPDWFLDDLHLEGTIADPAGGAVTLPMAGGQTQVARATLGVDFGGGSPDWQGALTLDGFRNGTLTADSFTLKGSGVGTGLDDPAKRRLTFNVDGLLSGVGAADPDVAAALGDSIGLGAAGLWSAGQPVQLAQFRLAGKAVSLDASGNFDGGVFDGKVNLAAATLTPFAGLAGRNLAGAVDLVASGTLSPLTGGFDLDVDGTATDLSVDAPVADRLLAGTVRLTGGLARTGAGVSARDFRIANGALQATADGSFGSDDADFRFELALADLGLLSPNAKGALAVTGTATGKDRRIALTLNAKIPQGALLDRPLQDAAFGFTGTLADGALDGRLEGAARLGGQPVSLASGLSAGNGANRLTGLDFAAGGTRLTGDLTQRRDGLYEGRLHLASTDLSTAAALALTEARGRADATIDLAATAGKQSAHIAARLAGVTAAGVTIGSADLAASVADLFGVPMVDGTVSAAQVAAAGVEVTRLAAHASHSGAATAFEGTASLATGTDLAAAGSLAALDLGYRLALDKLSLTQGKLTARLAAPTAIAVNGDDVTLDRVRFAIGDGTITASGSAGTKLDIAITADRVPLSAANAVAPGLGLAGSLGGTATIGGTRDHPQARFELTGSGIAAAALDGFGITPLSLTATGSYAGNAVQLTRLDARSPSGLRLAASGTVPLDLARLDVDVDGAAPLALANRFVADRGGQASGTAKLTAHIGGSVRDPAVSGKVTVQDGGYVDPALNLKLVGITGSAILAGDRVTIDRLTAGISTGGSLSASGTVSLRAPAYAADVKLALTHARYVDRSLLVATVSGNLALEGPLADGARLSGTIGIEKADITVPSQLGGGAADIAVKHIAAPKPVAASLRRAEPERAARAGRRGGGSPLRLDLDIRAPNQVFIRGRGLDAEMGGQVRLGGTLDDIQPVGGLHLIRGRLSILGQRVTFTSGTVTLTGDLDPEIALAASIPGDGITVTVTVSGRASDPSIDFVSTPPLPQDEVLSRLLFKQGLSQLSPLQLARLAGAASELAGGSGSSLLDSLRSTTGLDDLDLITDAKGNAAVQAGRYIDDNVYVGVQAGANGQSKVTVNLDLTPDLKASAASGSDGDSSVGLFYERDY
jgi:translocation and assembly module TamB